jgi:predicted nucleic acid-binding protein
MAGIKSDEEIETRGYLADFSVLEITEPVIERPVALRRRRKQKLPDCMIYATALAHNLLFVTRNSRDFVESDTIHIPYRIELN